MRGSRRTGYAFVVLMRSRGNIAVAVAVAGLVLLAWTTHRPATPRRRERPVPPPVAFR